MNIGANNNTLSNRLVTTYNNHLFKQNEAMSRISTGLRIRSAKDGASSYAISQKMLSQIRAQTQANENAQTNSSMVKTAQDALGNQLDILTTIQANAIKAANDSNTNEDRAKISEEIKQDLQQIDDIANNTSFNKKYLLNGMLDGGSAAKAGQTSSANAVTATEPKGNASVYSITGFKTWDTSTSKYKDPADDTVTLTSLVNENTGEYLFQEGDKIKFSWKDNGEDRSVEYEVTSSSTIANLVTALKGGDGANSISNADTNFKVANAPFTGVENSAGTLISATDAGIYIAGVSSSHEITDVSLSVTSSAGNTRTATQALLEPNAVQQTYGDDTKGSNVVYQVTGVTGTDGDRTAWMNLSDSSGNDLYDASSVNDGTTFKITVNSKQISITGGTTIEGLNQAFKDAGINVRAHIANADEVLTYDGETVTKGDINSNVGYKAPNAGLYFVAGEGENINSLIVSGGTVGGNTSLALTNFSTASTSSFLTKELSLYNSDDSSGISGISSAASNRTMLPRSAAVWFQTGDEANVGIQTTLGISTVRTQFGSDIDTLAKMVLTKEGAQELIDATKSAMDRVLNETTSLGSLEKRFGYVSDNIEALKTNLTNAVSTIRDSDPAEGTVEYTKNAVLANMAQAMLAMSNQTAFGSGNLLKTFGF